MIDQKLLKSGFLLLKLVTEKLNSGSQQIRFWFSFAINSARMIPSLIPFELMNKDTPIKISSLPQLYECLPEHERLIVDVLRQIVIDTLPATCKEKISYNVPFFFGNKGICIIWPAAIPRGGIKQGVLLGFWYGNKLQDVDNYLTHGTNKQIFYKIYTSIEEIDVEAIAKLLNEAVQFDQNTNGKSYQ